MHIVILGNGISGITAALNLRKLSSHDITVISSETDHFFTRTELMYVFMGKKRFRDIKPFPDRFWKENRFNLVNGLVNQVDLNRKTLFLNDDSKITFDKLILATGSKPDWLSCHGHDLDGVHGLYSLQDIEAMERHLSGLKRAVIVGGGLIGIEMAEMFRARRIPVTFLVREDSYLDWALPPEESALANRLIIENGVDLRLKSELKEIWHDRTGKIKMVVTNTGDKIECGFVGIAIGVHPNIDFLHFSGLELDRGIVVNDFLETSLQDVYAIGACAQLRNPKPGRQALEAMWDTGHKMGETVAKTICGNPTAYDPGIWSNSAKFFGVEYHVLGEVRTGQPSLYWEHPKERKSIRITYDQKQENILGFNLIGFKYSREACEKWILEKTPLEELLNNLRFAGFNPDLSRLYGPDLIQSYNSQTGKNLQTPSRRGVFGLFK